jgi:hypothetical protein
MAGHTESSSSSGQTGPINRRPATGRPRAAASHAEYSPVPNGSEPSVQAAQAESMAVSSGSPAESDANPRMIQTQAAYRQLVADGVTSQEAAGLISYVVGLGPCESRWTLSQVNRMLFLRDLYLNTDWGDSERRPESD